MVYARFDSNIYVVQYEYVSFFHISHSMFAFHGRIPHILIYTGYSLLEQDRLKEVKSSGFFNRGNSEYQTELQLIRESDESATKTKVPIKATFINVGDRVRIVGNRTGSVRFIGDLFDGNGKKCALLSMDDREEKELVPLQNILVNMGTPDVPEWSNEDKSNLFRDDSAPRWNINDLGNQETALKLSIRRLSQQNSLALPKQSPPAKDEKAGDDEDEIDIDDDEDVKHEEEQDTSDVDSSLQSLNQMAENMPMVKSPVSGNGSNVSLQSDVTEETHHECGEICFVSQKSFLYVSFGLLVVSLGSMIAIWEVLTQV